MTSTGTYARSTFSMSTAPINNLFFNGVLHLLYEIYFSNNFGSYNPVIKLYTFTYLTSAKIGIHILSDSFN